MRRPEASNVLWLACTFGPEMVASVDQSPRRDNLLGIVEAMVRELHPQRYHFIEVSPESRIERDLGIDSLARAELILRIERGYRLRLPARTIAEADTVQDLIDALGQAVPGTVAARVVQSTILPSVPPARDATTLIEVLEWHAARHSARLHVAVLQDETEIVGTLTYGQLAEEAKRVAYGLVAFDIAPGDRVALMLPTSLDFFIAFFGILYAGAIPVPIYPPLRLSQLEEHLRRQIGILGNAGACALVTVPEGKRLAGLLRGQLDALRSVDTVAMLQRGPPVALPPPGDASATALIQYTSGSTGDPKGVVLSHANLLANIRSMGAVMAASSDDVFVSWLPLYHDMGLIGAWLGCLYFGARLYAMPPVSFLVRPESWLWAMHRFRATFSAAPNFGFELCLNKIPDANLDGLDLTALRMVANGAEPVSPQTIRRFAERFGQYGFAAAAMAPVYGLAECSVGLAFPPLGRGPVIDRVNRDQLSGEGLAVLAQPNDPRPIELVACGQPLPGHEIRIVDQAGRELGDRREGRLEFRGPSTTRGYYRNEAKTRELFHDGWLDSGDRAYIAGGDVFVTGRVKDIIIRAGRHLYPQEIEEAVAALDGVRKGGVAVFSTPDERAGTERIVVLAETREDDPGRRRSIQQSVQELVTDIAGTPPDEVMFVPPQTVPKTSSGKIRRSAAKDMYLSGHVGPVQRAVWLQLLRLWVGGMRPRAEHSFRRLSELLYAGWWWMVVGCGFLAGFIACLLLPCLAWRWRAVRSIARVGLKLTAVPVAASGLDRLPTGNSMLVFNHASYADIIVLAAVLPGEPLYVAKRELDQQVFAGVLLRRLGALFVERYDLTGRIADTEAVIAAAPAGRNFVFFPEGTFTRRPGLTEFYLGAFKIAAEARLPVVPGVIRGTRTMLRSDQWFPRRSEISIEIGAAITPSATDFASVVRLRDDVRRWILQRCDEPDLAELVKP
jgi:1-acyl-sn-glycerol-3-phosphate acyltransferase